MKLDEKENYEMDLFQERMKSDLEKIKIHAIKPIVPKGIFPISQKNSAFSDLPYGKISTVSNAGCGPLAMEYAFRVNGFNVDFEELVNEVSKKGYRGYIYDEAGNIGKRYRRQDEIGTPYCITVDDETLNNGTVTIRDRDTMKQDIVKIEDVKNYIQSRCEY